jgi:hypothetical protein
LTDVRLKTESRHAHPPFLIWTAFHRSRLDRRQAGKLIRVNSRISNLCYHYTKRAGAERVFPKYLRLEVIALLCLKAAFLIVIYYAFFAPVEKPEPNGQTVLTHLLNYGK